MLHSASNTSQQSAADFFRTLPKTQRLERLARLTETEIEALHYDWEFWSRPEQREPAVRAWSYWIMLAGRGWGKTRSGAEQVRKWVRQGFRYVNLIGPTADDLSQAMVEGESGVMAVCPPHERPRHVNRELRWPNGAVSLLFSAEEPDRLRNKQHEKLWCDELAAWRYPDSWDQAQFGLRLGKNPQAVITTTPRPTDLVRRIVADPQTVVTGGATYDNRANLAVQFFRSIITKYEGTRLGRQELNAEILVDNPRALWQRSWIDRDRVRELPKDLARIVVGLDPNVKNRTQTGQGVLEDLDEAGIVVAARDHRDPPHFYVLDDRSIDAGPNTWGNAAVKAYQDHNADRVIGEVNNGGDMIEMLLRSVDQNVSYRSVTATRGKAIRAEPISALYEQGRVHHVGGFAELEDEMCDFDPLTTVKSPNRMDALVWALTELSDRADTALLDFMRAAANATVARTQPPALPGVQPGLRS